ncbi:MAG: xylulokinase [Chloroflexota bacterium]|nr:xylulokinase [Chloroflexota bacterium]
MTTPALLAIDLGTTQAKAGLVGLDGRLVALARATYPLASGGGSGAAEQDPSHWWTAIRTMTAELLAGAGPVTIEAIGVDGQGPTLVATAADGQPIAPAVTWLDTRSAGEEAELAAATGQAGWVLGILPRALWMERHVRAVAVAARWYLASWEWIGFRLTGVPAETTLPGQVHPDRAAVARTGLAVERIPPRTPAGTLLGPLLAGPAAELGLEPGIPVVAGMADAHASFLGAGLLEPGDAIDTGGTSGGFAVYTDRPIELPGVFGAAAPIPGRWFLGGAMNATGKALDWLREDVLRETVSTDELLAEAAEVPAGADGLVFLPYLAGERSPIWDPTARGAFVGLTLRHGRAHLARAVIEAADLALRHVATPIVGAGIPVGELRVSGGLARDSRWNQVKADVTGFAVAVPAIVETAMVGSAIAAGTGIGAFTDFAAGCRAIVRIGERFTPDPARRAVYDALYATYVELYPALRPAFRRMAELDRDGPA